jgi:hypothetical protein
MMPAAAMLSFELRLIPATRASRTAQGKPADVPGKQKIGSP